MSLYVNFRDMKKYPAFIIDRSRRSEASRYTDDFVVCTDRECGFISRIYKLPKSRREEFASQWLSSPDKFLAKTIGEAIVILEIVHFLNEPVAHYNRVPPLMKKALKAYLYGEAQAVAGDGSDLDKQIGAIEDVIRMAESQHDRLLDINGSAATNAFINTLRGSLESLMLLKKIFKNNN